MYSTNCPKELKAYIQCIDNPPHAIIDGETIFVKRRNVHACKDDYIGLSYDEQRFGFNRRFNIRPAIIVYPTNAEQVAHIIKVARDNPHFPLRAKSTGHDHESESTGTDAIVVDFHLLNGYRFSKDNDVITIGSGVQFREVIPSLNDASKSIPHGTCESVGVMGFTLGGGWGPWTRKHGMCCERLIGATLVDGQGHIHRIGSHVDHNGKLVENKLSQKDKELMWALRGGGGFSYGILTDLTIKTFDQPKHTLRFMVHWKHDIRYPAAIAPAVKILENWEKAIAPAKSERLLGTNIQIMAIPEDDKQPEDSIHECVFYGYYGADVDTHTELEKLLHQDLMAWFKDTPASYYDIKEGDGKGGTISKRVGWSWKYAGSDNIQFQSIGHSWSTWGRISTYNAKRQALLATNADPSTPLPPDPITHFPPDIDFPAPHKLTSRLVKADGLGHACRINLIKTLRSDLISQAGIDAHIHTYATLGAISGVYYDQNYKKPAFPEGSAFPYHDRPYTVQYQVWWDETEEDQLEGRLHHVYRYANQAIDWIQETRLADFPQTQGSFISFKDSAIPTKDYFPGVYEELKRIKREYANDENNLFRTRKTII